MALNRIGEIILLKFPYTNYKGSKLRPAVIISQDNENFHDYIVAYITSDVDYVYSSSYTVTFNDSDLEKGTVKKNSLIRLDKVMTVNQDRFFKTEVARLGIEKRKELLKQWSKLVAFNYYHSIHNPQQTQPFIPEQSKVPYAGRVFDENEIINLIDSSLDFWLTAGPWTNKFEHAFAKKLGVRYCSLVNSGSSANLLALMALTSPKLGDRRIQKGDEVITVASGFPTTINPILQFAAVPVFVDVSLPTYNIDVSLLEEARSERTKAVMIAHTLGNPFDIDEVKAFCNKYNLWLIEDNCDALGSLYRGQWTGTFGDLATSSFYPPHHITMGEGGAVYTNNHQLKQLVDSFRDWGRDCYCASGKDNSCKKRFQWKLGELPYGYDHKYIYSHLGYNLKATDMQAAIGCAQLEKLDDFIQIRRRNWQILREGLNDLENYFILPEATANTEPSWFGFILTIRDPAQLSRASIVNELESHHIQTRMLFAGNYLRHPVFDELRKQENTHRIIGNLENTDRIMNDSFWIGVYPGMKTEMLDYMVQTLTNFVSC